MNEAVFFYFFAALALLSALSVVTVKNPTRAILSLLVTIFTLAVLFVLLEAYFLAAILLLIYAGAIVVLFLFVVMLLGLGRREIRNRMQGVLMLLGVLVASVWLIQMVTAASAFSLSGGMVPGTVTGNIERVGKLLFTRYVLPFELTSVLLLVGIVGAVVLARRESS